MRIKLKQQNSVYLARLITPRNIDQGQKREKSQSISRMKHYNTQCTSQKMPSSIPITYPLLLPTLHQPSVFSQFLRVSYALTLSHSNLFFFSSPPPWVSVKFLRIHIRVKTYGICLLPYGSFHLASHSPVPSMLLQRAIFHSFSLPHSTPLCI